ncbi:MAG TPA: hypothetical protein VML75_20805 [Kofleriaceae bacterium]|nr:hypothetical protein [Kofleriaceae bacterium]
MSAAHGNKKHRHDVGNPDHGPRQTESVTKNIQIVLGATIIATAALTIYALLAAGFGIAAP